jgi:DegV family protein with EDD domain
MKLAIITDTSADIAEKYKKNTDLYVLEIPISIDGVDYITSELTNEAWYELMKKGKDVPKTSQPSVAELADLLKKLQKDGYTHVLGLFLTSGISGFYANAFYLQNEFDTMTVKFPETFITSAPLGFMIETAFDLAVAGADFDAILAKVEMQKSGDNAFMLVDDLHWLAKGGRLSRGGEILGTLLNIKPLLQFSEDGQVVVYDKVRTVKKAVGEMKKMLLETAQPDTYKVYVIHSDAKGRAQELYDYAVQAGYQDVEILTFGPVIATHLGLGAVAYAVSPK